MAGELFFDVLRPIGAYDSVHCVAYLAARCCFACRAGEKSSFIDSSLSCVP
jgi:hypothetical protein